MTFESEHKLGTDEAFLQLMTVSGNSLLKLFGMPNAQTAHYQFRAIVLKDKQLKPDVEGISFLDGQEGRVFIEFQGYEDKFIRHRLATEVFWSCTQEQYQGQVWACIVYTDKKYQKEALPLNTFGGAKACQLTDCLQEIVLADYTESQLVNIDPKLIVLAPFTLPARTAKPKLLAKTVEWQHQVTQTYPTSQQHLALNVLGLFILNQFRKLSYSEVMSMLNLDLMKSLAVQQVYQKGRQEGGLEDAQEMVLEALDERFGRVPKRLSNQIRALQQHDVLKDLLRQVFRCQDWNSFKEKLLAVK